MNLELLERLKKLTIIAMVSDDYLMEKLVLKGGNASRSFLRHISKGFAGFGFLYA